MHDSWQDRLSEYVDDELNADERLALESHLAECATCRALLAELQQVVQRAGALSDRAPDRDLWPDIASRLEKSGSVVDIATRRAVPRRVSFSVPQLVAAAVVLMAVSAGAVWLTMTSSSTPGEPGVSSGGPATVVTAVAVTEYDAAVAALEQELAARRSSLDRTTVAVLEENLRIIDEAIEEARAALERDPGNTYLNQHLAQTMWGKVRLLRRATGLTPLAS
ncbi:MAG: zf-HC2 domain-containing protein [Gemmatimonadota bacterium]|nr:zf-HC2 domain-containing protein [Gemmatimonadota bacterium]